MTLYILLRDHNLTPYNYSKKGPNGVMLKTIKDLSMSSSSPISFKVEWHNSWSDKWYQSQGHGFESRECYCERGIVGGTTIWLLTTTIKTDPRGVMSKAIKALSMSSSSLIGFEVEWHSSRFDIYIYIYCENEPLLAIFLISFCSEH